MCLLGPGADPVLITSSLPNHTPLQSLSFGHQTSRKLPGPSGSPAAPPPQHPRHSCPLDCHTTHHGEPGHCWVLPPRRTRLPSPSPIPARLKDPTDLQSHQGVLKLFMRSQDRGAGQGGRRRGGRKDRQVQDQGFLPVQDGGSWSCPCPGKEGSVRLGRGGQAAGAGLSGRQCGNRLQFPLGACVVGKDPCPLLP